MFTQVRLKDFKSLHGEHSVDLRRISVFIGPNGAGKSSVLQSLLMWRQSSGGAMFNPSGHIMDLGGLADLSSSRDAIPRLGLTAARSLIIPTLAGHETPENVEVKVDASIDHRPQSTFQVASTPLTLKPTSFDRADQQLVAADHRSNDKKRSHVRQKTEASHLYP